MPNIHDIAKKAGVSVSTVSRVLNNYKYVSDEKRKAVQQVIDEWSFAPNRNAIGLIRGETRMIGVIMPYNNNQAFDQMLHGALNRSRELDYSVAVLPTKYDKSKELEYLYMLKNKWLDGVIITSRSNDWDPILPYVEYGAVIACEFTEHPEIGCAYIDRYASYVDAFQYLKEKGHTATAFTIARGGESRSTQQTFAAYENVFGSVPDGYVISNCYSFEDGYRAAEKLLSLEDRPTAIFANGDEVAGGIYRYALSNGLAIPHDLAIMGQENQPVGVALDLCSIDHRLVQVGEQAFDLAVRRSRDKVNIPYRILARSSV